VGRRSPLSRATVKRPLGVDVLKAARARIGYALLRFPKVCVSFSGGKDSGVLLHLVMEQAIQRGIRVGVLFLDWEAQFKLTIDHVAEVFDLYREHIDPYWVALPLTTTNAVSMHEPEWTCWDPAKRELWVRDPPDVAITDHRRFPFYYPEITFEQFVDDFGRWYSGGQLTASFVGIRCGESLNRWRSITMRKSCFENARWTTWKGGSLYNAYPLYDWKTADVWTYFAHSGLPYNRLYDRMHQAGLTPHQMRICEPYGDEQRQGLWLFHAVEPETWSRVCARVAGANSGALYANERGNILGNRRVELPEGHTWRSFAMFLLDTMPPSTAEHYRDKIAIYLNYCQKIGVAVPDFAPGDTGGKDVPSWRRICKVLLRNDFWCKGLSFSPQKAEHLERYRALVRTRRDKWGVI
jgi:predicted phosphoadenosine phosphosulfate sulfurtransferase